MVIQNHICGYPAHQVTDFGLAEHDTVAAVKFVNGVIRREEIEVIGIDLISSHDQTVDPLVLLVHLFQDATKRLISAFVKKGSSKKT